MNKEIEKAAQIAAEIFANHGWRWGTAENGVPTEEEIQTNLKRKVETLLRDDTIDHISSGRLRVSRIDWGEGVQDLILALELGQIFVEGK